MQHTIHYNVQNGGDGSAYPRFFSSAKLAAWDESHDSEGWAESSTGSLVIDADGPIKVSKLTTPESYLVEMWDSGNDTAEFAAEFFPDGIPHFDVCVYSTHGDCHKLAVSVNGSPAGWVFCFNSKSPETVAAALNAL